ncbi:GGDEF domain-containing protein, partial [Tepidimonas sp.]|uniref:GGDEF domain-containing protein n=1 Tax=Tepidimonas sp. TaxID=2002775 RepID=UPI002FE38876
RRWRAEAVPGQTHAALLIDLDNFKPINDQAGHDAGDALLRRLALLLREQSRPVDAVARLGGDEFAVLLYNCDETQAVEVAQRILDALQQFVFEWQGRLFRLGASIGVVTFDAGASDEAWSDALKRADDACYAAKRAGRGCVVSASNNAASPLSSTPGPSTL